MEVVEVKYHRDTAGSDKPFKVQRPNGQLSKESYWTRKSAKIAMKKGRCTFE